MILRRRALLRRGVAAAGAMVLVACGPASSRLPTASSNTVTDAPSETPTGLAAAGAAAAIGSLLVLHTNDAMGYVDPCG